MKKKQGSQIIGNKIQDNKTQHSKFSTYSGAIVLGLNDALVEISGALVGLAGLQKTSRLGARR